MKQTRVDAETARCMNSNIAEYRVPGERLDATGVRVRDLRIRIESVLP